MIKSRLPPSLLVLAMVMKVAQCRFPFLLTSLDDVMTLTRGGFALVFSPPVAIESEKRASVTMATAFWGFTVLGDRSEEQIEEVSKIEDKKSIIS